MTGTHGTHGTQRRRLARQVASAGGLGDIRFAPGTAGSVAAAGFGAVLLLAGGRRALLNATGLAIPAGLASIAMLPEAARDPGWVVVDEVAGQFLAMLWMDRITPGGVAASLALFRLLDIAKPGPIGRADRMRGPLGVMLDDVLAGLAASAILWVADLVRLRLPRRRNAHAG